MHGYEHYCLLRWLKGQERMIVSFSRIDVYILILLLSGRVGDGGGIAYKGVKQIFPGLGIYETSKSTTVADLDITDFQ